MNKTIKALGLFSMVLGLNACGAGPEFTPEAERLGKLTSKQLQDEFRRLGTLQGAPGPIPTGQSEGKGGLFIWATSDKGWSQTQQDIGYAIIWAGKVFHNKTDVACNPEKGGSFWLDNRVKGLFKWIENIPGGGKANVYYEKESWIGDGMPTITIDYEPTPKLAFIHDEMRLSNWSTDPKKSTYLGIMWITVGTTKVPFAYFIPDQVDPAPCDGSTSATFG